MIIVILLSVHSIADGEKGCAFIVFNYINNYFSTTIKWLDKNGKVNYEFQQLSENISDGEDYNLQIMMIDKKHLIYKHTKSSVEVTIIVTRNKNNIKEEIISDYNFPSVAEKYMYLVDRPRKASDKKGFFLYKNEDYKVTITRFDYK